MDILHLNYLPSNIVVKEKKILEMAKAAERKDLPIRFLVLNDSLAHTAGNIEFRKIGLPQQPKLKKLFQMLFRYTYLNRHLKQETFDLLVLRYPLAMGIGALKFYKHYGHKIYTEHHTNEVVELQKISNNKFFGRLVSTWERVRRRRFLSLCRGVIGVSSEVTAFEQVYHPNGRSFTFSNGIDVKSVPFTGFAGNEEVLNILFLAGRFAPWHALDRLLAGLKQYAGDRRVRLMLVGNLNKISHIGDWNHQENPNVELKMYGQLNEPKLTEICRFAHVAISSLGIHRVGLEEASVLKTREYMARGIPFIYAYMDSDLKGNEPFAKRVPANDEAIHIQSIVDFYEGYSTNIGLSQTMRNIAEQRLDWSVKLENLIKFLLAERD
ncbi:MAG: glycosyltransferase [Candidatus Marinimicrobia bacterium]|nr:glycosyltransferase [Candidatus Neomarinimicrobiota bacterium]MCF7850491.1 glycosyltransferase [Candidatus Neomarinimicrobiota bacterium]